MSVSAASLSYYYPEIVLPLAKPEKWRLGLKFVNSSAAGVSTQDTGKFAMYLAKVKALELNQSLWVEGTEPPSEFALTWARAFIQQLEADDFSPTGVVASAEGGVGIYFVDGDKYADLECLNSGAILGVISNRSDRPVAWEVEQDARGLARASERVREFLDPSQTNENVSERQEYRRQFLALRAIVSSLRPARY